MVRHITEQAARMAACLANVGNAAGRSGILPCLYPLAKIGQVTIQIDLHLTEDAKFFVITGLLLPEDCSDFRNGDFRHRAIPFDIAIAASKQDLAFENGGRNALCRIVNEIRSAFLMIQPADKSIYCAAFAWNGYDLMQVLFLRAE